MSEFDVTDPAHICDERCRPYVPLLYQDLEDLEESDHIDALYDILNRTRERAALVVLGLARETETAYLTARAAALLLDLDEEELAHELGEQPRYPVPDVIAYAIRAQGEDGYVGTALTALFREQLGADFPVGD